VTGYLERGQMDRLISTVDIVVSLRFPHVGETSATLGAALAAGRPVVVQATGSWGELPGHAVLVVPAGGDEVAELAGALEALAADPAERRRLGEAALAYAAGSLGAGRYAHGVVDAARAVALSPRVPPSARLEERRAGIAAFLDRTDRLTNGTLLRSAPAPVEALRALPPARPGARLLDIGGPPPFLRLLEGLWGYEVESRPRSGDPGAPEPLPDACGAFDVVTCWDAPVDLAEVNRILAPEGLLVWTSSSVAGGARYALDRAGMAADAVWRSEDGPTVALARKVTLPASAR